MTFESFEHLVLLECRPTTTRAPAYALQAQRGADQRKPRSAIDFGILNKRKLCFAEMCDLTSLSQLSALK